MVLAAANHGARTERTWPVNSKLGVPNGGRFDAGPCRGYFCSPWRPWTALGRARGGALSRAVSTGSGRWGRPLTVSGVVSDLVAVTNVPEQVETLRLEFRASLRQAFRLKACAGLHQAYRCKACPVLHKGAEVPSPAIDYAAARQKTLHWCSLLRLQLHGIRGRGWGIQDRSACGPHCVARFLWSALYGLLCGTPPQTLPTLMKPAHFVSSIGGPSHVSMGGSMGDQYCSSLQS
eukprot:132427-Chlamydomonas_euryale.AAC.2